METQLPDRLSALEQENAMLRSRLQACEQSHALLQAEVAEYRRREQDRQAQTEPEPIGELTTLSDSLEHRLLEATAIAANTLLTIEDFDQSVNTALKILGESLETDRINVIEFFDHSSDPLPHWRMLYEWHSPNTPSQIAHSELAQGTHQGLEATYKQLAQGQGFSYLLDEMPEPFRSGQAALGVKALHVVPIFVEDKLWGIVGFDDCCEAKRRSPAELAVLKIAANCLGSAIQRERTQQALLQTEQLRSQELEHLNTELQQTLDRLTESEQRYRQLMELASEGIYRMEYAEPIPVDLPVEEQAQRIYQHFRYAEHNLAFAQMYGYDEADALVGTPLSHVMDAPENVVQMEQFVRNGHQMKNQETIEFDRFGRKRHFFNNGFSIIRDGYAIGGWGTQIDITELRETQQTLLQAEQERAAELAKANEALRNAIAGLARLDNLDQFLSEMLKISLEVSGAHSGAVCLIEGDFVRHAVLFDRSGWVSPEIQAERGTLVLPFSPELRFMAQQILKSKDAWVVQPDDPLHPPSFQAFHREQGNRAIRLVPMRVDDRLLGWLGLGFAQEEPPLGRSFALLRVLAEQMTMAVEMLRLAEEAKQIAIAREQEKAAQERAAQLAKANQVLQRTASQLVGQQNLDRFLEQVLMEVVQEIGAVNNAIFLYDRPSHTLRMQNCIQDEQVVNLDVDPRFELWRHPIPADINEAWRLIQINGYIQHHIEENKIAGDQIWDFSESWHRQMQHRFIISVLLQIGNDPLGFMGICFREPIQLSSERIELVQALANQAALAVQLTRLAEEAQQAAILDERNRMAQDVHDTLAQSFTGVIMQLEATKRKISNAQPDLAQEHIARARSLAQAGLSEARRSVRALCPESLESNDLPEALHHLATQMTCDTSAQILVEITGTPYPLPIDLETNLLRIAQEAVTNALRHAEPQSVHLHLQFTPTALRLSIIDDGQGFDPDSQIDLGFGLLGMQERSQRINGEFSLSSTIGQGTEIVVVVSR